MRSAGGDKRERILSAAERIFARRGFYHAKVAEIARDAGVADGTIYLYFKSKDDLLISLFETRMEQVNQQVQAAAEAADTPRAKLEAVIHTHLDLVRTQPHVAEVLTIELRQSSKFMKESPNPRFAAFLKLVAGIIADGQAEGVFATDVPAPQAARMVFGIIDELALAWLLGRGEKFDISRAADWACAFVSRGLDLRAELAATRPPATASTATQTSPISKRSDS
jgi:TetR/AcrR family fatty acid metabolism transcriptional regulator